MQEVLDRQARGFAVLWAVRDPDKGNDIVDFEIVYKNKAADAFRPGPRTCMQARRFPRVPVEYGVSAGFGRLTFACFLIGCFLAHIMSISFFLDGVCVRFLLQSVGHRIRELYPQVAAAGGAFWTYREAALTGTPLCREREVK